MSSEDAGALLSEDEARERLRTLAIEFLAAAWERLVADHIAPRPKHQPRMKLTSDWFWGGGSGWPLAGEMEQTLEASFPRRFRETDGSLAREFASVHLPLLVEDMVALQTEMPFDAACAQAVNDLIQFLDSESHVVMAQRIVSHVGVAETAVLGGTGVEVTPLDVRGWIYAGDVFDVAAVETDQLFLHSEHPHVLLTSTATYRPGDRWDDRFDEASTNLDHAVALLRLFRRTSARNVVEYRGFVQRGALARPLQAAWRNDTLAGLAFAGTEFATTLDDSALLQFAEFERIYVDVLEKALADWHARELEVAGMQTGLNQFTASFSHDPWMVQVPRLITALEAWLLPEADTEAVTGRLRTRLCLLLQEDAESCAQLYSDVTKLYGLRSSMEHGADVVAKKARRTIRGAAGTDGDLHGINGATAIERLRELVRKAICVRLVLASGDAPAWPIIDRQPVDVQMLEDGFRRECRQRLREESDRLGLTLFEALPPA